MKLSGRISKIGNPIARAIFFILFFIILLLLTIPAIPYAIVKGLYNLDYYEEWIDFIKEYIPL